VFQHFCTFNKYCPRKVQEGDRVGDGSKRSPQTDPPRSPRVAKQPNTEQKQRQNKKLKLNEPQTVQTTSLWSCGSRPPAPQTVQTKSHWSFWPSLDLPVAFLDLPLQLLDLLLTNLQFL